MTKVPLLIAALLLSTGTVAQSRLQTDQEPVGEVGSEDAYRETQSFDGLDFNDDRTIDLDEAEGAIPRRDWDAMDTDQSGTVTRGEYTEWFYRQHSDKLDDSQNQSDQSE